MKKVTLLFPNERELKRFNDISQLEYLEYDIKALTITCVSNSEDIELAKSAFRAEIINEEEPQ